MTPTREHAWRTLTTHTSSEASLRHALALEAATAAYARRFGEDEELWRAAALLRALDGDGHAGVERVNGNAASLLRGEGYPEEVVDAVVADAHDRPLPRRTLLAKTLFACDESSRFVRACGLARATGLDGLDARSVRQRLRQPAFAPGVSREDVTAGAEVLGLALDEHLANVVGALRPVAHDLGLPTAADGAGGAEPAAARPATVTNLWYALFLGLDQLTARRTRLALAFLRATYRGTLVVTGLTRWSIPAIVLSSVLRRRRVVLLELQHIPVHGWRALAVRLARPLLGGGIAAAQVLSSWEVEACHRWLGIPADRIRFIPWPLHGLDPGPATRSGYVFVSGRAALDWETLFHAAEGRDWPLVVVCAPSDARDVARLNAGGRARVFVDIPRDEHHRLLKEATVCVLPLVERHHSAGHIRIMDAMSTMTPVVTTRIRGLVDYVVPGETALVVEPGDADALRDAIERLLADEALRRRLAERALATFGTRTLAKYEQDVRDLVYAAAARS